MADDLPKAYQYQAFLSYAREDEGWARWLQRTIERYRVPKELVGQNGRFGLIKSNLSPVFRDREDLEAHGNLTQRLRDALERSRLLIVVCSPASATSKWVETEIQQFLALGRADRILAVIVAGDPEAVDERRCFPQALLSLSDNAASLLPQLPLAADARPEGGGKQQAGLMILAGMLGISLTDLTQREVLAERRRRRFSQAVAALLTILAIAALFAAGLAYWQRSIAVREELRANKNLDTAVDSLERIVFGISRSLRGVEGVSSSALRTIQAEMIDEIDAASQQSPDDTRIAQIQVAILNELAEISLEQSDHETLMSLVIRFDALTERFSKSETNRSIAEYSRSISLYYQGRINLITGDFQSAAARFQEVDRNPPQTEDPENDLEIRVSALIGLGDSLRELDRVGEARIAYQNAIHSLKDLPDELPSASVASWRMHRELWQLHHRGLLFERLGQIEEEAGNHSSALSLYSSAINIAETLSRALPSDTGPQLDLAIAQSMLGRAQTASGDGAAGLQLLEQAAVTLRRIDELSPGRLDILQPHLEILEEILEHLPPNEETRALEHTQQAIDAYKNALRIRPDDRWRDRLVKHSVEASRLLSSRNANSAAVSALTSTLGFLDSSVETTAQASHFRRLAELHGELAVRWQDADDLVAAVHEAKLAVFAAEEAYARDDREAGGMAPRLRHYATLLTIAGQNSEAAAVLDKARVFSPGTANLSAEEKLEEATQLSREAFVLFQSTDVDASIVKLKGALALLPEDPRSSDIQELRILWFDTLGGFYLIKKDWANAKGSFENGLNASQLLVDSGEIDEITLGYFDAFMGKLGWIAAQENDRETAISWFNKAVGAARLRSRKFPSATSTERALAGYHTALQLLQEHWPESRSKIPLVMP